MFSRAEQSNDLHIQALTRNYSFWGDRVSGDVRQHDSCQMVAQNRRLYSRTARAWILRNYIPLGVSLGSFVYLEVFI